MKTKKEKPLKSSSLRQRAEEKLKNRTSADVIGPDVDVHRLYHELQVQQVELEIREEELQLVLENAISATELFDLSPTGYFTLKPDYTITRLNRSGALMLGSERPQLVKANFNQYIPSHSRPAFQSFIQQTFGGKSRHKFETYFTNKGISRGYFQVEAVFLDDRNECLLMVIEISELKLAAKALSKSESRFKTMFDLSTVAIYETDAEGKCLLVNHQWCIFAGISEEQAKGEGWQHAIHPDDRERIFKLWDEYAQNNQPWNFEYRFCTPDQKITWVLGTAIPLKTELGEIYGFLGMNTDITELKRIEEELQTNYSLLRTAGQTAKFGGWIFDLASNRIVWSDQVAAIHEMPSGYSPVLNEGINLYAPEWRETIINCVNECAEKGTSYDRELEIVTAKGKRIWVRTTGEAVRNEQGEIVKIQGSFQDITTRKLGEAALHKSEEKWRKLVNTIPDFVVLHDRDGKFLFMNHFVEGFSPKDIEGKTYKDFIPDESKLAYETLFDKASKTGETQYIEFKGPGDNYSIREYESFLVPIFEDNQFANMLVIARDITERKTFEHALQESEARLRELNATKDKFFSIIAHDLKNPFNSIIGFSNILAEGVDELEASEIIKYSSIIHNSSKRAMDLLSNLLDWARSQTGRMLFAPEQFDIQTLVNREIEILKDSANLKNILIANKIAYEITIFADKSMVGTVMRNLISNAIKFTSTAGQVIISASQKSGEIEVAVADSGTGIKKELLGKLFHIEESLTTSGTQNERGTGLGLILCKEFIEKHGGKIWVESEVGKGSTFRFTIPVQRF